MIRTDIIRLYKSVHTWTGIVTGMALFIAFYAGALTVFKEPIARWVTPPSPGVESVPLADAPALIAGVLRERPQAGKDFHLYIRPGENVPARLGWHERQPGADAEEHDEAAHARFYTASLQGRQVSIETDTPSALPDFIDTLHRVVGLPRDIDPYRRVMGVVAGLYTLAILSGLIVLLPTLVKDLLALRIGHNLKRMWLDAHNLVGLASLPFHLVMALSSVVFAYHDDIYLLQDRMIHGGRLESIWRGGPPAGAQAQTASAPKAPPPPRDPSRMIAPADLLAKVHELAPTFQPRAMQYLQVTGPRASVRVWGFDEGDIARSSRGGLVSIDPYSGRIQNTDLLPGRQSASATTLTSFFTLHFATFGGAPVRWMYFVLGLAGAFLFYSGNLLWVESRRKAERKGQPFPAQKRSTVWMAAATVGVCLGCVCGISLSMVAGKWLHGMVNDLAAWHQGVYYGVFFACIAWSFTVGAARAGVHLLWLAAASTLAIPLTTLTAFLAPSLGWWAHDSAGTLGVDLTALTMALAWAWLAALTARRAREGRTDSVWSAQPATAPSRA